MNTLNYIEEIVNFIISQKTEEIKKNIEVINKDPNKPNHISE
jgi:hypothetical protein